MPTPPQVQPLEPTDLEAAWQGLELAFGGAAHPADRAVELALIARSRAYAAYDAGTPVATAGAFDLELTVPGAVLPVAGVTWVSVQPTYRRRGLLRALMDRQLSDLHEARTAVAALWAAEGAIYQRFGYGLASLHLALEVPRGAAFSRPVRPDGLRLQPADPAVLGPVHDVVAARTPGWHRRDAPWWDYRLHDPDHRRAGQSPLRCLLAEGPDGPDGYALFATTQDSEEGMAAGVVHLRELAATTPEAAARMWRFLLDLDLTRRVEASKCPLDEPLLHLLAEPRAAHARVRDGLWVRLVDVGAALEARRYAAPVDVVLDVEDPTCPWNAGRWHLSGGPDGATCSRTSQDPELRLGAAELGATYLGGPSLTALAGAGRVDELRPGALAPASTALGWGGPAPYAPMVF